MATLHLTDRAEAEAIAKRFGGWQVVCGRYTADVMRVRGGWTAQMGYVNERGSVVHFSNPLCRRTFRRLDTMERAINRAMSRALEVN